MILLFFVAFLRIGPYLDQLITSVEVVLGQRSTEDKLIPNLDYFE
jgi:hypothetical protein